MNIKAKNYGYIQKEYKVGERVCNNDGFVGTVTIQEGNALFVSYDGGIEYSLPETIHTIRSIENEVIMGKSVNKYV